MQFLISLNDVYKTVRGNLIMMRPLPSLSQAYNAIFVSHIVSQTTAFSAQTSSATTLGSSMENDHIALAGQQQRRSYNTNYKPRDD